MSTKKMMDALRTLDPHASVGQRGSGRWWVHLPSVKILHGRGLDHAFGDGDSEDDAIGRAFAHLTGPLPGRVIEADGRRMRWNGTAFVAVPNAGE